MSYIDRYILADDVVTHLSQVIVDISDPFIETRYIGFVAVAAVTVYELSIKDIFFDFGQRKHRVLGNFTQKYFDRLNGQISIDRLKEYAKGFDKKYESQFKKKLEITEEEWLRKEGVSVKTSYSNVLQCRHKFAHLGEISQTNTFAEITRAYQIGKEVIRCLDESMRR